MRRSIALAALTRVFAQGFARAFARVFAAVFVLAFASVFVVACSGNAVVEPGDKQTKRAKAFIAKCNPPAPPGGTGVLEEVYACLVPEDACPDPASAQALEELGYVLEKEGCGTNIAVYDVPCGPDLNAIDCCYVVRVAAAENACNFE